jgi:hypothetical protein
MILEDQIQVLSPGWNLLILSSAARNWLELAVEYEKSEGRCLKSNNNKLQELQF